MEYSFDSVHLIKLTLIEVDPSSVVSKRTRPKTDEGQEAEYRMLNVTSLQPSTYHQGGNHKSFRGRLTRLFIRVVVVD